MTETAARARRGRLGATELSRVNSAKAKRYRPSGCGWWLQRRRFAAWRCEHCGARERRASRLTAPMESPAITGAAAVPFSAAARPLLAVRTRPRCFASISFSPFSGGGGGRFFGGGGGGGGGDDSGAGPSAAAAAAAVALGETETADGDVILLRVGGMSCGGCAASVKRILECQPEVTSATVDFEKKTAAVWTTPEAKATKDWQKQLGEKLAHHLSTCGFQSHLLGSLCHSPQVSILCSTLPIGSGKRKIKRELLHQQM
ncbi:hypothetical protein E2562_012353 [Oryza meyeriana var. granulata]|uniref:HMA domain-containing protein n=1 Tax=Oryza meyeriana var. granulata TaxID=110450 RepID=A0A6G1DHC9_9ORYZ|nr:hypothetical protein E2562_012353 [Oryza meyeriana var. granulata]